AIFAYNNANWYVDSVLLRAKLVGGMPADLVSSLTGLTDGLFPVHATAKYADDVTETAALAHQASTQGTPAAATTATNIYAQVGAPVIAVKDGVITAIGDTPSLGRFIALRDGAGNTYTYSQLGPVSHLYAAPKAQVAPAAPATRAASVPSDPAPRAPASAGHQPAGRTAAPVAVTPVAPAHPATDTAASAPQRLFAYPARRAAYAAGGWRQIAHPAPANLSAYLVENPDLKPADVELRVLAPGAEVVAGTILARIGAAAPGSAPHLGFQIRPAGKNAPLIDAKPILDGWKLVEATAIYRAAALNPIVGQNPTIGQILLESKAQLQRQVLADPAIDIYACGRRDIEAGLIDQRVLATLEFLSASGFDPSVT
ncbi:MAG TPA: M23 family metallopeptidase, partial [Solirubrobacteraceae bacterium]|nr:M23 family metallopeptidase [Solirubrobacteraceae bacterium]